MSCREVENTENKLFAGQLKKVYCSFLLSHSPCLQALLLRDLYSVVAASHLRGGISDALSDVSAHMRLSHFHRSLATMAQTNWCNDCFRGV
jgi:hypothetical protein